MESEKQKEITLAVEAGVSQAFSKILPFLVQLSEYNTKQLADLINQNEYLFRYLPQNYLRTKALEESMDFIKDKTESALFFTSRELLLKHAIKKVTLSGQYLEFGVSSGHTINLIAESEPDKKIFGFDSFEGLPEDWTGYQQPRGAFSTGGKLPAVKSNVTLIKGLFTDTLPQFFSHARKPIAFLHCDVDLYSSTKCVFEHCKNLIVKGTVIVFDEFFNYPNWQQHEAKAFIEFISVNNMSYEFIGFAREQAAVVIK